MNLKNKCKLMRNNQLNSKKFNLNIKTKQKNFP